MPTFDIVRKHKTRKTFRVASIIGTFDLPSEETEERFSGSIDLPNSWNIGMIVGASGTGKTTIAKELFPESYITDFEYNSDSFLDDFPKESSVSQISEMLNSVGFCSPPSWLKPYNVLSNGQKMRVDLANALLTKSDLIVFDEFTSVVDRQVAKFGSHATQKAVRKNDKKFIAVSCHYDIEEWLQPDWVFDTNSMTFRTFEGQKKKSTRSVYRHFQNKK